MKRRWLVGSESGDQSVEADEVETTPWGVLVFYPSAPRRENERSLLLALSPDAWRRCELESDA